ncbi:MAG TPA: hypothetical protein VGC42_26590 [Kofleriaceae bacterium]
MRLLLASLLVAGSLAGCAVTHAEDDQPPGRLCPASLALLLDPSTGTCMGFAPPECTGDTEPAHDDFAGCHSTCDGLGEADCLDTAGCRAGFLLNASAQPQYWTCWATAPSGPDHSTACTGLSALDCSRHDNCAASYLKHADGTTTFDSCGYQPGV